MTSSTSSDMAMRLKRDLEEEKKNTTLLEELVKKKNEKIDKLELTVKKMEVEKNDEVAELKGKLSSLEKEIEELKKKAKDDDGGTSSIPAPVLELIQRQVRLTQQQKELTDLFVKVSRKEDQEEEKRKEGIAIEKMKSIVCNDFERFPKDGDKPSHILNEHFGQQEDEDRVVLGPQDHIEPKKYKKMKEVKGCSVYVSGQVRRESLIVLYVLFKFCSHVK